MAGWVMITHPVGKVGNPFPTFPTVFRAGARRFRIPFLDHQQGIVECRAQANCLTGRAWSPALGIRLAEPSIADGVIVEIQRERSFQARPGRRQSVSRVALEAFAELQSCVGGCRPPRRSDWSDGASGSALRHPSNWPDRSFAVRVPRRYPAVLNSPGSVSFGPPTCTHRAKARIEF